MEQPSTSFSPEDAFYQRWALVTMMFGIFMAGMDTSIVMISLPRIQASLGASIEELEWVANGYLLAQTIVLPTAGKLSDIFGCKRFYTFSLLLFVMASALCGMAWSPGALIFFRVIQGIGAGIMMTTSLAIVSHTFPPSKFGQAMGIWMAAITVAAAAGPSTGGYLTEYFGWESIFLVNVPIGITGAIMSITILKETQRLKHKVDVLGFFTLTISLTSFLIALVEAQKMGWDSDFILGLWWLAIFFFVIFIVTEIFTKEPMVDLGLFKNINYDCVCLVSGISTMAMFVIMFLMPLYMENILNYSTMKSALAITPAPLVSVFLSPIVGRLLNKMNPKILIFLGIISLLGAMHSLSTLTVDATYNDIALSLVFMGFGIALILVPCVKISQEVLPRAKVGIGAGVYNLIRYFASVVGIAMLGVLLEKRIAFHMVNYSQYINSFLLETQLMVNKISSYFMQTGSDPSTAASQAYSTLSNILAQETFIEAQKDIFRLTSLSILLSLIPLFLIRTPRKTQSKVEKAVVKEETLTVEV